MVLGLGEDGVKREDTGAAANFLASSSCLLNSHSVLNVAFPGSKYLVLASDETVFDVVDVLSLHIEIFLVFFFDWYKVK